MADINKILHSENNDNELAENIVTEKIQEENKPPVDNSAAITKEQEVVIDEERLENSNIAIDAKEDNIPVTKDATKPLIEQNNFVENVYQWFKDKQAENEKLRKINAEQSAIKMKETSKQAASRLIRGIINGRVESINELIIFGYDVLDIIMHDQMPDLPHDWKAINYGYNEDSETEVDARESRFFVEYPEDKDSTIYGLSKGISQWVIPTLMFTKTLQAIGYGKKGYMLHKSGGLYKKLGITKKKGDILSGAVAGATVDATLTSPYDENLFNWLEDKYDLNSTIIDFLSAPDTEDTDLEDRLRGRLLAVVQGYAIGEVLVGKVAPETLKGADKLLIKPTQKALNGLITNASAYMKEKGGTTAGNMVDFIIEQFVEMKKNPTRRAKIIAKLDDILKKNGGDIGQIENELADDNLLKTLSTYKEAIDNSPELFKYNKDVPIETVKGVPLRYSKITRTFNPRNLYKNFFEKSSANAGKIIDGELTTKIGEGQGLLEYISKRGELVKRLNKNNTRSIQEMYLKSASQLPEDTLRVFTEFSQRYGVGGEIDLQSSIIALNDMISESSIVIKDLSSQLIDILKMSGKGSLKQEYYQVLKEDFAYSLQMMSDMLNIKNIFKAEIGKTLRVINETSPKAPEGLNEFLRKSNVENLLDEYKVKSDLGIKDELVEDPLQSFSVSQLIKLAEDGDPKELLKVVSRINLAAMNPRALKMITAAQKDSKVMKITNELFINSILASPITHQINIISTGINTLGKPITKVVGGIAMGDPALITRAYKDMVYMLTSLHESAYMAGRSFLANKNILDSSASTIDLSRLAMVDTSKASGLVKLVHGFYTLPQRFLMAEDEFFKQINFRSYVKADIWERSSKMNFKSQEAYNKYVTSEFNKIINTVNRESMVGKLSKRNQKLLKDAQLYANQATFTEDLMKGTSGKAIQTVVNQNPVLRQIIPFVRTPLNILKQFNKSNPLLTYLGGIDTTRLDKFGLGKFSTDVNKNPLQNFSFVKEHLAELNSVNKNERAIAKGRSIMGGFAWAGGMTAAWNINDPKATIAITGGLPANKMARENLLATGFMPYSFRFLATEEDIKKYGKGEPYKKVPDKDNSEVTYIRGEDGLIKYKYVSYKRLEPYANFLAISADAVRVIGHLGTEDQLQKDSLYQVMMSSMYNNLIDKNFLRGITEIVEVMRDEATLNAWLMNRISQLAIPMSSLTKNVKTAINSGAFGFEKDGNVRLDKSVGSGAFTNSVGGQDASAAPFIMVRRLLNEIASKTPFGNWKARPMQHHITGKLMTTPVGFGRDSWNIVTDGWSNQTVSNNDLVLSIIHETGMAAEPPSDQIFAKDNNGIALYLNQEELGDLIFHTATYQMYYKGNKMRMYDAMKTFLKSDKAIQLIEIMRGNIPLNKKGDVTEEARKFIAQQTGDPEFLTMPFDNQMKTTIILNMRSALKDELEAIHTMYKKGAKEHYLSCDGGKNNKNFCYPKQKQDVYNERKRQSSKWSNGFKTKNQEEDSYLQLFD
tara:strand:- start:49 stop:4566 length:4518 start_codon:yes stop_codon:yes gene_type:complete